MSTPIPNPNSDFSEWALSREGNAAKVETRQLALDCVRSSPLLWDDEKKCLRCGWLELAGQEAPTLDFLLREGALNPEEPRGHFHGIDLKSEVIRSVRERYPDEPRASWAEGNLFHALGRHGAHGTGSYDDVGVLVYDSTNIYQGEPFHERLPELRRFALRQWGHLGEFLLILNVVHRGSTEADFHAYRKLLGEAFQMEAPETAFHRYRSRKVTMVWTAIRFGFGP